jgi:hypothetical protein
MLMRYQFRTESAVIDWTPLHVSCVTCLPDEPPVTGRCLRLRHGPVSDRRRRQ